MSGATAFDYDSARRIARTVHGFEKQNGDQSAKRPKTRGDDRGPMVKTPASLPGGYDGTDPLEGTLVERLPDDSILEIATVYIKNADDLPLEADKVYLARASGHATVSSTPRPLFLVDVGSGSGGLTVGWYAGGAVAGSGGMWNTTIALATGGTTRISNAPWGLDAANSFSQLTSSFTGYGVGGQYWKVLLEETTDLTTKYHLIPFMVAAQVSYYVSVEGTIVVNCRARSGLAFNWRAFDPLKLVPTTGIYNALLQLQWKGAFLGGPYFYYGFQVIAVNTANPVSVSSGVTLSGTGGSSAFPTGMGSTYGAPGATVSGVE